MNTKYKRAVPLPDSLTGSNPWARDYPMVAEVVKHSSGYLSRLTWDGRSKAVLRHKTLAEARRRASALAGTDWKLCG